MPFSCCFALPRLPRPGPPHLLIPSTSLSNQLGHKKATPTASGKGNGISLEAKQTLSSHLTTVFLPIVYIIVFVVGLPANALAVWVFLFRVKKKHPSLIYMANLALADLMFVIWVPLKIAYHFNNNDWIYGEELCKVLVGFFYANMYCSILFITCFSVQRYRAVVDPLSQLHENKYVAIALSVAIWVAVWVTTAPLYLYKQTNHVPSLGIVTCHDVILQDDVKTAAGYFLTVSILGFLVPSIVCSVSYVLMLRSLRTNASHPNMGKKRRKAVVLIITVLVLFIVCFAPSNIMLIVHYSLLLSGATNNLYHVYVTSLCLASLNSCIDPFVYYYISEDFRNHIKNTFLCRSQRLVDSRKVSSGALKYSKSIISDSAHTQSSEC
ncbi:hypothetical protein WMY93_031886 [Mugilogobius chulae]|uniref:G-protein coupled receptors family 1 profile domain-containing protein n=1 Tax=Mugilogobius chulae TaxID=88201 RepID=A0AAW0MH90_9GOBI